MVVTVRFHYFYKYKDTFINIYDEPFYPYVARGEEVFRWVELMDITDEECAFSLLRSETKPIEEPIDLDFKRCKFHIEGSSEKVKMSAYSNKFIV